MKYNNDINILFYKINNIIAFNLFTLSFITILILLNFKRELWFINNPKQLIINKLQADKYINKMFKFIYIIILDDIPSLINRIFENYERSLHTYIFF